MAKKETAKTTKLTKNALLKKMEITLQELTLLMSALKADRSTAQANLEAYQKKFEQLSEKLR
ncbi:MAG: hypothetical protein HC859_17020 [Bacteroidia bacterium]|nr:hypothetical protein [Bacteroidia bacterium]